ncbi:MAG: plasma-membrane proton-efflux P-type ATPase [Desulfobacteraceae bacterium 4572_19]|nr:MAG: plasma-membrane proton-efflux P-type ATPase [Desulfobacteraceae bacterium 4572_19]
MAIKQTDSDAAEKLSPDELLKQLETSANGLSGNEAQNRLNDLGPNALTEVKKNPLLDFLKYFWGPIPWMIEIAAILSIIARDVPDFIIIMIMLIFNGLIGFWEEHKASNALDALKKGLAPKARCLRDGQWAEIDAVLLVPGDVIKIRLGDVIPADAKLIEGDYIKIDQAALTGESLPVDKKTGDLVYSGSIAKQGEMIALVAATGEHTFFGRTAKLVAGAGAESHFQQAVMRIGNFLILLSLALCAVLVAIALYRDHYAGAIGINDILDLAKFVLILAIASIPVAMPAVLSVTMALGALAMSKKKAIVSRLQAIEEMAGVDILCSDKTGTLTKNQLTIAEPVLFSAKTKEECILGGAIASREEDGDAIDSAIIESLTDKNILDKYKRGKFTPFDPVSKRTEAMVTNAEGQTLYFTKGAPQVIIDMSNMSDADKTKASDKVNDFAAHGYRALGVASSINTKSTEESANKSWDFLGVIPMYDPPRDDSKETIEQAHEHGLDVKMITGDDTAIGAEISRQLGMGTNIQAAADVFSGVDPDHVPMKLAQAIEKADGFGRVFPEHKYAIVKSLQERGHIVAMTGDGVNDAPALKQADAGVAVSGATEAAQAAAALILTAPGLSVIIHAINIARQIFERMMSYTIYRIAMTIDIMFFVVLAMMFFPTVEIGGHTIPFKPISSAMIIILALLDDIPIMTIAYDNTRIDPKPVRWQMDRVLSISCILGLLAIIETFGLLFFGMQHIDQVLWGVKIDPDHIQTMMFLQLVVGGHLLLFVTRSKESLFKPPYPAKILFGAIMGTQIFALILCAVGVGDVIPQLPWQLIALVWGYNLVWMVIQDIVKLIIYKYIERKTDHQKNWKDKIGKSLQHYSRKSQSAK